MGFQEHFVKLTEGTPTKDNSWLVGCIEADKLLILFIFLEEPDLRENALNVIRNESNKLGFGNNLTELQNFLCQVRDEAFKNGWICPNEFDEIFSNETATIKPLESI